MKIFALVWLLCLSLTDAFTSFQHRVPLQRAISTKLHSISVVPKGVDSKEQQTDMPANTSVDNTDDILNMEATTALMGNIVQCLVKSDLKRQEGGDGSGSTGWTSWVDDKTAFSLRCCIDQLALAKPVNPSDTGGLGLKQELLAERDETISWLRWLKATPSPVMLDLSDELREVASSLIYDKDLEMIESTREEFLARIGVNMILLPSGKSLDHTIRSAPGALVFGKLFYGGANRYRLLPGKMKRRTGDRTAIMTREGENIEGWLQYGGPERNYEAVDMGPCAILEVIILPYGLKADSVIENHMGISYLGWEASKLINFWESSNSTENGDDSISDVGDDPLVNLVGKERNEYLTTSFTENVGGLKPQIDAIVRRVLDGRIYQSYDDNGEELGSQSLLEAKELASLGLTAVRGLLLYGPPGCGKTFLARSISKALKARKPKVVSAPELLDRWVGGSEKMIRSLFEDAEAEMKLCGGDATKSSLHVIVIDEIDAVFRKRSASEDSGSATRASAVNQILSKLDGVNAIPNVLLIGMTNRRELLDDALLRPGRLEVQIEIPLPDKAGRREILQIHFEGLRQRGRLSEPLCKAIDGFGAIERGDKNDSNFIRIRSRVKAAIQMPQGRIRDLAVDTVTGGYSGADIAGLVRCAGSVALARARKQGMGIDSLTVTLDDVVQALEEVKG